MNTKEKELFEKAINLLDSGENEEARGLLQQILEEPEKSNWKRIMHGSVVKGPDYWSNGHFALFNSVCPMPEAVSNLDVFGRTAEPSIPDLIAQVPEVDSFRKEWITKPAKDRLPTRVVTRKGIRFDKKYIDALEGLLPGFHLRTPETPGPCIVMHNDIFAGVLMPLRDVEEVF